MNRSFAHFSWATWAIFSRSLFWHEQPGWFAQSCFCPERSERITHSRSFYLSDLSEWAMNKWANSQSWFHIHFFHSCKQFFTSCPFLEEKNKISAAFNFFLFTEGFLQQKSYEMCFQKYIITHACRTRPLFRNYPTLLKILLLQILPPYSTVDPLFVFVVGCFHLVGTSCWFRNHPTLL